MSKAIIVHGWAGSPDEPALVWLKEQLEQRGMEVVVPEMPDTDTPRIEPWVGKLAEVSQPDENTVFVGHSVGCQAILRYLETLPENMRVAKVILFAPWMELDMQTIEDEGEESIEISRPWMETPIDFKKVRTHAKEFVAIFSDNDPYVPLSQKEIFERELGAHTSVVHGKGHFSVGDGIHELPEVLRLI